MSASTIVAAVETARVDEASLQEWHEAEGYRKRIILYNLRWIRRFSEYCARSARVLEEHLTLSDVARFVHRYALRHRIAWPHAIRDARRGFLALRRFLESRGVQLPAWVPPPRRGPVDDLLDQYDGYRQRWRPVSVRGLASERNYLRAFLSIVGRRPLRLMTLKMIDDFVMRTGSRVRPKTLSGVCTALRSFLRFLHATGRVPRDLAVHVVRPMGRSEARPSRALPPRQLARLLKAIDRTTAIGQRDYAIVLLAAAYGMGAAEICRLQIDDVEWQTNTIRLTRPKTGVMTELPLLAPVARALLDYLQHGRPGSTSARQIFLRCLPPHGPIRFPGSAVRGRLHRYAARAGISADCLGAHVLRRTHASTQVELGTSAKVVSEILGQRHGESLTPYVRHALERLRPLSLPVPR